jgi:hypothetical protein
VLIKVTSPNVPVAPAAAKILGISADPNYQRPPPPSIRPFNPYDNHREMSPPPGVTNRQLFDPSYAVYMGPPNTSTISPQTSQYVDPVAGIYLGPPEPPVRNTAMPGNNNSGMFMGGGGGGFQQQRPPGGIVQPQPPVYRDPEYAEVEFNRGLRPQQQPQQQQPQQMMGNQFNSMPSGPGGMQKMPGPGFPGFQQPMSSYPQNNRRMN